MRLVALCLLLAPTVAQSAPWETLWSEDFQALATGPLEADGWTVQAPAPDTAIDVVDDGGGRFLRLTDRVASTDSTRAACLASLSLWGLALPAEITFRLRISPGPAERLREDMGVMLGPINGPLTLFAKNGEWQRIDGPGQWVPLPVAQRYHPGQWTGFRLALASDGIRVFVDGQDTGLVPLRPGRLDRLAFTSLRYATGCLDVDDLVIRYTDRERLGFALLPRDPPVAGQPSRRSRLAVVVRMAPAKYRAGYALERVLDGRAERFEVTSAVAIPVGDLPDGPAEVPCRLLDAAGAVRTSATFAWTPPAGDPTIACRFPIRHVPLPRSAVTGPHTLYFVRLGDLDGDGRVDFLVARGALAQDAYTQDGRQLWGYEDRDATWADLRPDSNVPVWDLDGDGRTEVVVARRLDGALRLCVLDGATGEVERSIPYPRPDRRPPDQRGSIIVADLRGQGRAGDVVVSWDYGYVCALNDRLELLWERDAPIGHTPLAVDLDGDGRDELVAGQTLLSSDGTVRWTQDMAALGPDSHVDSPDAADLDGNPANGLEIVSSTGAALLRPSGEIVWQHGPAIDHGQRAQIGDVLADVPGREIWVLDRTPAKVHALDVTGRIRKTLLNSSWFLLGDWDGDGRDDLFLRHGAPASEILNGGGRQLALLPDYYSEAVVADVLGDQRVEFILASSDGQQSWLEVYTNPAANPHPSTAVEPVRGNLKAWANWTCY